MFCPRCSQQQLSDEVRFCSRCGFQLTGVAQLMESGGQPAEPDAPERRQLTARQYGVRKGGFIVIAGLLFCFIALLLTLMEEDFLVLFPLAAAVVVYGILRVLYAMWLEGDAPRAPKKGRALKAVDKVRAALEGTRTSDAAQLPPARTRPAAELFAQRHETAEMAQPPSVTESTTRLLEDEAKKQL